MLKQRKVPMRKCTALRNKGIELSLEVTLSQELIETLREEFAQK